MDSNQSSDSESSRSSSSTDENKGTSRKNSHKSSKHSNSDTALYLNSQSRIISRYIDEEVGDALVEGMEVMIRKKSRSPLRFLANYLRSYEASMIDKYYSSEEEGSESVE